MDYRISGERLKGFADQVRRISGVEGELTPEQMETNLLNVTVGADLPNAEAATFGVGTVAAELPDDYQIQRTTMDDIAEEVQRLTGATEKLSTAQIITELSEVEVLEDYEEVAF